MIALMQKTISKILAELMVSRGVSQADLSRKSGVGQPTISRILKPSGPKGIKNPTDTQVKPIADYFGISTDQLRGYSPLPSSLGTMAVEQQERHLKAVKGTTENHVSLSYGELAAIVTPRSKAILDRIILASAEGRLSDADIELLDQIAARFEVISSPKAKGGANNKKLRDRLSKDDTDARQ